MSADELRVDQQIEFQQRFRWVHRVSWVLGDRFVRSAASSHLQLSLPALAPG